MNECADCGGVVADGREHCFKCRIRSVGFRLQGGAKTGSSSFHTTKGDWLREHMGTDSEKQLAKRTDIERA